MFSASSSVVASTSSHLASLQERYVVMGQIHNRLPQPTQHQFQGLRNESRVAVSVMSDRGVSSFGRECP